MNEMVDVWVKRLKSLTKIAKSYPHAAYAAYTHGEQHRYSYFMQTILDIEDNLKPIDSVLEDEFIPALFGRDITSNERDLIALPVKEGGLGIRKISEESNRFYASSRSKTQTAPLINRIIQQSNFLPDADEIKRIKSVTREHVNSAEKQRIQEVKNKQSLEMKRTVEQYSEPGASQAG